MKTIAYVPEYEAMTLEKRKACVPPRSVCSLEPARDDADYMYTGNGSHRVDLAGDPYEEDIRITQELLYEPLWKETPLPPDLRPYLKEIRQHLLEGKPELVDPLIDEAQRKAGFDKYMNLDAPIVYPAGAPHVHKAFSLRLSRKKCGKTTDYLRWLDMMTAKVTTHWVNEEGKFSCEALPVFGEDLVLIRLKAPAGKLTLNMKLDLPGGPSMFGVPTMVKSAHTLEKTTQLFKLAWGYNPEFGDKGFVGLLRFISQVDVDTDKEFSARTNHLTVIEDGMAVAGATELLIAAKVIPLQGGFAFGCENTYAEQLMNLDIDFDRMEQENLAVLGAKMNRSRICLGKEEDQWLSGEELLKKCHGDTELYPMMMDKLYDMGRFYQIVDTGSIPPMWGQHNINTNLQVCAGNNTGLFDEMDVYFRYYEDKFEDFRTNARLLFGARGLLASVHCDFDSGLYYHFSRTYPHYCWTGCLGWIYNEFWGYYLCTGDKEFLKIRILPALEEIALFFKDYACDRDENGKVIFYPSFSPEDPTPNPDYMTVTCKDTHATRINSVMDIAICREVLMNLIEGSRILNVNEGKIPGWEKQLEDLPDYLLDEEGALKEWSWPTIEENYNHRHVSHHYDLWPGRAVTQDTEPEVAEAILLSNRKRGQQDDSAHGIIHRAFCAARLHDVEEYEQNMSQLINHGFVRRNLSTAHFPYRGQFPDLQGAMPALLLEMCVSSRPGVIDWMPAVPLCFREGTLQGVWLYTQMKLETVHWNREGLHAVLTPLADQTVVMEYRKQRVDFYVDGNLAAEDTDQCRIQVEKGKTFELDIRNRNFL